MSFSSDSVLAAGLTIKKFESQGEVDDKRKRRQEEWEKVRKPEDPDVCPEVPVDNRCLYDKLEEQRVQKQEEHDEKYALRNQVKGLDEDEANFLDFVSDRQQEIERERNQEEVKLLTEMKDAQVVKVATTKTEEKRTRPMVTQSGKRSQMALLAGAVKRKGPADTSPNKKAKISEGENVDTNKSKATDTADSVKISTDSVACSERLKESTSSPGSGAQTKSSGGIAKVIGVLPAALPGLTHYEDSSDSMSSSSDSEPDFSLAGRNLANQIKLHIQQHHH